MSESVDEMVDRLSDSEHKLLEEKWSFFRLLQMVEMAPVDAHPEFDRVRFYKEDLMGNVYRRLGGQEWVLLYDLPDHMDLHYIHTPGQDKPAHAIVADGQLVDVRRKSFVPVFQTLCDAEAYRDKHFDGPLAPHIIVWPCFMGSGRLATSDTV